MWLIHFCINRFFQSGALVIVKMLDTWQLGISKLIFHTNCNEMLDFMNFNNGGTYVHWRIMEMLVFYLNLSVIKMIAMSAYLWMSAYS